MIALPDLNVLFALFAPEHPHNGSATRWLENATDFATCSITETGLIRLLANTTLRPGATTSDGLAALRALRSRPGHHFLSDDATLAEPTIDLRAMVGSQRVTDFHLVNLAARHGATLVTFDRRLHAALRAADRRHVLTLVE